MTFFRENMCSSVRVFGGVQHSTIAAKIKQNQQQSGVLLTLHRLSVKKCDSGHT